MILMRASNGIIRGVGNARLGLIFGLMDAFIFVSAAAGFWAPSAD